MAVLAALPALFAALGTAGSATAGAAGLAGATTTLGSAATSLSAIGAVGSGVAGALSANYQSQVARNNAAIENANMANAIRAGQTAESNKRIETGLRVGQMAAAQGANDVDVGYGTTKGSRLSAQTLGNLDALTIRYNATREAYGYGVEARNFKTQGNLDEMQAGESVLSGVLGGAKSYIGGAAALAGQRLGFQQAGVPGYGG